MIRIKRFSVEKFILLLSGCMISTIVLPQNYNEDAVVNLQKYWYYRERLREDFMIGISVDAGCSLPANTRQVNGNLGYGDATMTLANYIGVLATEYKLLSDQEQNTDLTLKELYYAIYAFNRLDYYAETYFQDNGGNFGDASLNGFFIRQDVNPAVINQEIFNKLNNYSLQDYPVDITGIHDDAFLPPGEESKDQVLHLVWGLGLVVKFVPASITYDNRIFQDNETSISQEAKNIVDRIINYMCDDPNTWSWTILNPITGQHVERGWDAFSLSIGFVRANSLITGISGSVVNSPQLQEAKILFENIFKSNEEAIFVLQNNDQDDKVLHLASSGQVWGAETDEVLGFRSYNPIFTEASYDWLPLLNQIMFPDNQNYLNPIFYLSSGYFEQQQYYNYLLNIAPCFGPFQYGDGNPFDVECSANWEWSGQNRLIKPNTRGCYNDISNGDYNGLDYMLLHNLYYIQYGSTLPAYEQNYFARYIMPNYPVMNSAQNYPTDYGNSLSLSPAIGSVNNPITIQSYTDIIATNIIDIDGDVSYQASNTIHLLPGFKAKAGSAFHAYIDPVSCDNSITNSSKLSSEKTMENQVGISFVEMKIDNREDTSYLRISPNPSDGNMNVVYEIPENSEGIFEIYDIIGHKLMSLPLFRGKNTFSISDSELNDGIYFYHATVNNELIAADMVVVIK